jgi:flagellar hook assembly protein FlgD
VPTVANVAAEIDETEVADEPSSAGEALTMQSAPDPFDGQNVIDYSLPRSARVELRVFDTAGHAVRSFAIGDQEAGEHRIVWDGRGDDGKQLAPGAYYYELVTPGGKGARRAILLR